MEDLKHYGVKGMRWGVRRAEKNAVKRSNKIVKKNAKAAKKKVRKVKMEEIYAKHGDTLAAITMANYHMNVGEAIIGGNISKSVRLGALAMTANSANKKRKTKK